MKLTLLVLLYGYQFFCHRFFKRFQNDEETWGSARLRLWNEVATLFLFAIVFVVVLKDSFTWIWGIASLILLSIIMMLGIKFYAKARTKNEVVEEKSEEESAS